MSYLVLARKSRPQTFSQVIGQQTTVKTLQNSLVRNRVAHAILFSGVRGVGKTTLARIMAKALNCTEGPAEEPCNKCDSCRAITNGSAIDLTEIDGASNRGIQEIRELKEKLRFLPTSSKYKIIIIDEVHMLTTEAFNALLKTLEEPPKHVYFMFATTELHKIPITILSRCQRYELKRVSQSDLTAHFHKLAIEEGYEIDTDGLALIVRESEGSVRDGLSLLDQVFSFGEQKISVDDVIQVLGLIDRQVLLTITSALLDGDRGKALSALDESFDYGIDLKRFTADLLGCFRNLLIGKIKGCDELLDLPDQEVEIFKEQGAGHSAETIHMKLNLLMQVVEELRYSSQPRLTLETGFLKIIEAGNVVPVATLLAKLDSLLQAGDDGTARPSVSPPTSSPIDNKKKRTQPVSVDQPDKQPPPKTPLPTESHTHAEEQVPHPADDDRITTVDKDVAADHDKQEKTVKPVIKPHPHQRDVRRDWNAFIEYVKDRRNWMAMDLQQANQVREEQKTLLLHYEDSANCSLLRKKSKLLTEFVLDFFQKELKVRFILPDEENDDQDNNLEYLKKQRQLLVNDPLVVMAAEIFNGRIGDIRVGPRFRQP